MYQSSKKYVCELCYPAQLFGKATCYIFVLLKNSGVKLSFDYSSYQTVKNDGDLWVVILCGYYITVIVSWNRITTKLL